MNDRETLVCEGEATQLLFVKEPQEALFERFIDIGMAINLFCHGNKKRLRLTEP